MRTAEQGQAAASQEREHRRRYLRLPGRSSWACLLYTSDAADDSLRVDLGGRRIIKKKIF